jgi:tripartite-type tricarboxylate transporter receptor subunit TctC
MTKINGGVPRRAALAALMAVGLTAGFAVSAWAQAYPNRPVRIIVPFPAGGPLDIMARAVADKMSASLKQNVLVENRAGASGNIGSELVAKAEPDGYTLLIVLNTTLAVNPSLFSKMPFDPARDLRPLSMLTSNSQMLAVHPTLPVKSVKEFVALANKETISYASAGHGSPGHLVMEYFRLKAGFKATMVPYKGNAPLMSDLVAGHVKVGFVASAGVLPHAQAGRLRTLATSAKTRSKIAPEVPTIDESGYPGFNVETHFVFAAPAGLPDSIAAVLEREANAAIKAPDVQARLLKLDIIPIGTTGKEAAAQLAEQRKLWAEVVKAANMRID